MHKPPLYELTNIVCAYEDEPVLQVDSLSIPDEGPVAFVGHNGSGKSTLLKLILRLLKPTRGSVVTHAGRIGYVPQKSDRDGGFPLTVFEMLDSYRRLLKIRDGEAVRRQMALAGLSDHAAALIDNLSGGQGRKALIARALIGDPDLLILDEPTAGLDMESQREIYRFIKRLNEVNGITVVSVEHNLDAAISNSTLIYHLAGGRGHICSPQRYADEYILKGKRKEEDLA
jgi:zinc transport system ATP-binding protein